MPPRGTIEPRAGRSRSISRWHASYTVSVSVWDGYRRSAAENVTINVTNLNDNAPVITAGPEFRIDDGSRWTDRQGECNRCRRHQPARLHHVPAWTIVSGNPNNVFRYSTSGQPADRPAVADRLAQDVVFAGSTVSDGANTSAAQTVAGHDPEPRRSCAWRTPSGSKRRRTRRRC